MTTPEGSRGFFQGEQEERNFLRNEFGLIRVDPIGERGLPYFAYLSEFDGWAVEKESFLGKWLDFSPVKRLKGVAQLGLNRNFPLPNTHTRFDHSAELTVRTVLSLRQLARDHREEFLKMSSGYSLNLAPNLSGREKEEEQILKAIKLGAIYAASHDIATPAGGDGIKYVFGLDDDQDLPDVLSWNSAEFSRLCQEDGFDPETIAPIFTKIAQRNDEGILGQLIHKSGGENRGFDLDSICYTLMDAWRCLDFFQRDPFPDNKTARVAGEIGQASKGDIIQEQFQGLARGFEERHRELNRQARGYIGLYQRLLTDFCLNGLPCNLDNLDPRVSFGPTGRVLFFQDFVSFTQLVLKEEKVVFTDPYRMDRLWLLNNFLVDYLYFHPSLLGPEIGLMTYIRSQRGDPVSSGEKRYLLTVDDHRLLEDLKKNSPRVAYWFSNLASLGWEGSNLACKSPYVRYLSESADTDEACVFTNILLEIKKMPTRLGTPVLASGETRNLGEVFPNRGEDIEKRKRHMAFINNIFPAWSRPLSIRFTDEYIHSQRHRLEREPYW